MPEGPEVKTIVDGLSKHLEGKRLLGVDIHSGRYSRHGPFEGYDALVSNLPKKIDFVDCKGKLIFIVFDDGSSILNTLGMTGSWRQNSGKHAHVSLHLEGDKKVFFKDVRNFGTLKYVQSPDTLKQKLSKIGPDMLSEEVSNFQFISALRTQNKKTVAQAIMNQSVISGVGNYLKSESLYHAKISPHRLVKNISDHELASLNKSIKKIIRDSYRSGGATIYSFKNFDLEDGKYTRRFAVYNQKEDLLGNPVVREKTADSRTTFWVESLQK